MDEYPKISFLHYRVYERPDLPKHGKPDPDILRHPYNLKPRWTGKLHPKGGRTIARIDFGHGRFVVGESNCSMSDNFCRRTGRVIALARAMELLDPVAKIAIASKIGGKNAQPDSV